MKPVLPEKEKKEEFIKNNFDEIAINYDKFNDIFTFGMHRIWKKKLLKLLKVEKSKKMIDLCCGTGDIAIFSYYLNKEEAKEIIGCDFSRGMLNIMEKRLETLNLKDKIKIIEYNVMNISNLYNNYFDIATVGYGIRNVKDRDLFFKEVYKILNQNGKMGILEVGKIEPVFIYPFAYFFIKNIIPLIGYILQRKKHEMYDYLPSSSFEFPPPEIIKQEILSSGFRKVSYKRLFFGASVIYIAEK